MIWNLLKFGLPIVVLLAVAVGTQTRKTFHVEQVVEATPDEVWAVLMETSAYSDWNPVFVKVDGTYEDGVQVVNHVVDPDGKILEMTATVKTLSPRRQLRQTGGIPGIITFDHQWLLESVEVGTKVTQHEVDRGIYLWFWDSSWIEPAYASVNDALADRLRVD
ncbi:SRPBCC family protein [Tropicibacter sp. R16_0]|uniref:SRPBCC family protein n=1 Tax=Tropicibacter sp. R16_0 TaxID=2821102 RepID=UPI001ADB278E|nr:SRPBCC family protein [Tropicibacter sp. R16_0]MBO9451815.1 SRPBCC family protein [Tropicibacter sp. R16_0]